MHICWFVRCRLPRKYKNPMECIVQNDQNREASTKVLLDLNFVHRRATGKPSTIIEVEKHLCTTPSCFYHFVHCCIGFLYWVVWQSDEPTVIFSCQWTLCTLLSGSNLSEFNAFTYFWTFKIENYRFFTLH